MPSCALPSVTFLPLSLLLLLMVTPVLRSTSSTATEAAMPLPAIPAATCADVSLASTVRLALTFVSPVACSVELVTFAFTPSAVPLPLLALVPGAAFSFCPSLPVYLSKVIPAALELLLPSLLVTVPTVPWPSIAAFALLRISFVLKVAFLSLSVVSVSPYWSAAAAPIVVTLTFAL